MQKFTLFTVFAAIIVLSLVFEISSEETNGEDFTADVTRENFGEREFKNSLEQKERGVPDAPQIRENDPESESKQEKPEEPEEPTAEPTDEPTDEPADESEPAPEPEIKEATASQIKDVSDDLTRVIRQISSAFSYHPEKFGGKVFQLIEITDVPLEPSSTQGNWQNQDIIEAVAYELQAADEVMAAEVYQLIRKKTALYPDITVNETNKYGDGSLYINHARKPNEAFLVVRVKKTIYGFAYGKTFHENIEKLMTLLTLQ